jgi:hypothetical protein
MRLVLRSDDPFSGCFRYLPNPHSRVSGAEVHRVLKLEEAFDVISLAKPLSARQRYVMRTNCPDFPGLLQARGGPPPETH